MAPIYTRDDCELFVDPDIESLLPALDADQYESLKQQVVDDGVFTNEIAVWDQGKNETGQRTGPILDGHNRDRIWCELPDDTKVPQPRIRFLKFESKSDAMLWVLANQDNRRNMTRQRLAEIRAKTLEAVKKDKSDNLNRGTESPKRHFVASEKPQENSDSGKSAAAVAKATGTTSRTVERDSAWVNAVQKIQSVNGKAAADLRSGTLKVSMSDVIKVGKQEDAVIVSALKNWRNGNKWDHGTAAASPKPKVHRADADMPPGQVDCDGTEVPKALIGVFEKRDQFTKAARMCRDASGMIAELKKHTAGRNLGDIGESLIEVAEWIESAMPWKVDGRGWLAKEDCDA